MKQGTPEWLEFRKSRIGASDAPIIMGDSPWCTPYQLWLKKLGLSEESSMTPQMQRGVDMEEKARAYFCEAHEVIVEPVVKTHAKYEWMIASLDGISEDHRIAVEIKCPGKSSHEKALNGFVPAVYKAQLQHQMAVCGLGFIFYYSFDGADGVTIKVDRDDEYIETLIEKEKDFYQRMVTFTSPEFSERDFIVREDKLWVEMAVEYRNIKEKKASIEAQEELIKKKLIEMCEGKNSLGAGVKVQQIARKGNIEYSSIPEIKEMDLEIYRKPATSYWKIL